MEQYSGKSIFKGTAIGRIFFYSKDQQKVRYTKIEDAEAEIERYEVAKEKAVNQLYGLYERAVAEVGEMNAMIFEIHAMMLEDDDYNESVYNIIRSDKVNAEFAVATTGENFSLMFSEMEDDYFKARAADVKDISERLIMVLSGSKHNDQVGDSPVIVVAEDLAPSETVQMDKTKLLAFVTKLGSTNSHTAILARTMNIPALIGVEIQKDWDGKMAIVDGKEGVLYVDPDYSTLERQDCRKDLQSSLLSVTA